MLPKIKKPLAESQNTRPLWLAAAYVIDLRLADMANGTFRRTLEASQHHLNHLPSPLPVSSLTEGFR